MLWRVLAFRYVRAIRTHLFHEPLMTAHRVLLSHLIAAISLLGACSEVTPPAGETISVCHLSGTSGVLMDIKKSELMDHREHGDYVAALTVRRGSALNGDGIHFARITDAISSAREGRMYRGEKTTALCRITISVSPGTYLGRVNDTLSAGLEELPLTIDVPDITLLGSLVMSTDSKGRASGTNAGSEQVTTIGASPGLISIKTGNTLDKYAEPLIVVNGHPNGPRGDGAIIEGFVLQSGNGPDDIVGGNAVWAMRAKDLVVRGNRIEGGFSEPVEMRSSVGRVERNVLVGKGGSCALCMFGPGDYKVIANRQVGATGRLSVLVFPAIFAAVPPNVEQLVLGADALVTAEVTNNEFRNHQEVPFGIGLRVAAIGPGAPNVTGTARVIAQDNDLSDNRFGVVAEAGFLVAGTAQRGSIDLKLKGNTLTGSCQVGLLVAFNGQATAVGTQAGISTRNSTITLDLGNDISWADAWYSHPAGAGNTLMVNGQPVPNGSRAAYDARPC